MVFLRLLTCAALLMPSGPIIAMDYTGNAKLWLPKSYQRHYMLLRSAADTVTGSVSCYELLSGTLAESLSSLEHPHFRFTCRNEQRKQFTIIVDGLSMTMYKSLDVYKEMIAKVNQRQKREQEAKYWSICKKEFDLHTELMRERKIITPLPPTPVLSADSVFTYTIDFDAANSQGRPLAYRAHCQISDFATFNVEIRPRRLEH